MLRIVMALIIVIAIWSNVVKPAIGDYYGLKFDQSKRQDASLIVKARSWDPESSSLALKADAFADALQRSNGDITPYSVWFALAIMLGQKGDLQGAKFALEWSLYYYPDYDLAKNLYAQLPK
jgi:hypothetical protein